MAWPRDASDESLRNSRESAIRRGDLAGAETAARELVRRGAHPGISTAVPPVGRTLRPRTDNGGEMGFWSTLGSIGNMVVGAVESQIGIDIPFVGPSSSPSVPGGSGTMGPTGLTTVGGPCVLPWRIDPITGECKIFAGSVPGPDPGPGPRPGQHAGMALSIPHNDTVPVREQITRRTCTRGSVLGLDGWCHPKGTIRNRDRMWPKPRRPLLSGGELNAINIASKAGTRVEKKVKQLQKMGMMPKTKRA
jgi:hypothetical protein